MSRGVGARGRRRSPARPRSTRSNSKALLRAYGIPLPPETFVEPPARRPSRPRARSDFRSCSRRVSAAIPHKSDAGLVILDVRDADGRARARRRTLIGALPASSASTLDGILVAQQMSGGIETVLGVTRDLEMGPVVMFGLGGIWLELFKDVALRARGPRSRAGRSRWCRRRAPAGCSRAIAAASRATATRSSTRWSISAGSRATSAMSSRRSISIRSWCASAVRSRSTAWSCCGRRQSLAAAA